MKGIKLINPLIITGVNDEFKPFANVDAKYGPYTDIATARSVLEHYLTKGLTIGIIEGNEIVEYWIKDDSNEFVIKNQQTNDSNEDDSKIIMVCLGDTHRTGDYDENGNMEEFTTVTKEENLQRNIKAYNDIRYCSDNDKPFTIVLDNYTLAKELNSPYKTFYFIPEYVIGYDKSMLGDDCNNELIRLGYDPTKYDNTIVLLFYHNNSYAVLFNDGVIIRVSTGEPLSLQILKLQDAYKKVIKKIDNTDLKQVDLNNGDSTHSIQLSVDDIFIYNEDSSLSIYHDNGTLCTLIPNHIYKVVQSDYKDTNNNVIKYAQDLLIDDRANGGFTKITNKIIDGAKKVNYIQHTAADGELNLKIDRTSLIAGNEYKIIIENTGGDTDDDFKVELSNAIIDRFNEENLPIKCLTVDGSINIFVPPTGILVLNLLIYEQNYTLKGLVTYEISSNCIMAI